MFKYDHEMSSLQVKHKISRRQSSVDPLFPNLFRAEQSQTLMNSNYYFDTCSSVSYSSYIVQRAVRFSTLMWYRLWDQYHGIDKNEEVSSASNSRVCRRARSARVPAGLRQTTPLNLGNSCYHSCY